MIQYVCACFSTAPRKANHLFMFMFRRGVGATSYVHVHVHVSPRCCLPVCLPGVPSCILLLLILWPSVHWQFAQPSPRQSYFIRRPSPIMPVLFPAFVNPWPHIIATTPSHPTQPPMCIHSSVNPPLPQPHPPIPCNRPCQCSARPTHCTTWEAKCTPGANDQCMV